MTERTLLECFTLLSTMNCGREQEWSDRLRPVYALVLRRMDDPVGKSAVEYAVMHEDWRPSPARLLEIAAEIASPVPDAEATYAEIVHKAQSEGLYAMPHPDRPSIKLEGPPQFSHPIIDQVMRYCGGWEFICTGEANRQEGLKKQVRGAHESCQRQWREEVKKQICLPPKQRDPKMFPAWKPYQLPGQWTPDYDLPSLEPPRQQTPALADLHPEVQKMIRGAIMKAG